MALIESWIGRVAFDAALCSCLLLWPVAEQAQAGLRLCDLDVPTSTRRGDRTVAGAAAVRWWHRWRAGAIWVCEQAVANRCDSLL